MVFAPTAIAVCNTSDTGRTGYCNVERRILEDASTSQNPVTELQTEQKPCTCYNEY